MSDRFLDPDVACQADELHAKINALAQGYQAIAIVAALGDVVAATFAVVANDKRHALEGVGFFADDLKAAIETNFDAYRGAARRVQ